MSNATQAPALSLRERALAAYEERAARAAEAAARRAREEREADAQMWADVRVVIRKRIGIDADWSDGPVMIEGAPFEAIMGYRDRHKNYAEGVQVWANYQWCEHCGEDHDGTRIDDLADLGAVLADGFTPRRHHCIAGRRKAEPEPDAPCCQDGALVEALRTALAGLGVRMDGGGL